MYVAVGAVSFYGLLLTQGRADDLLEDVGQDVRGCTLTETHTALRIGYPIAISIDKINREF
jgi:hypothetical protein